MMCFVQFLPKIKLNLQALDLARGVSFNSWDTKLLTFGKAFSLVFIAIKMFVVFVGLIRTLSTMQGYNNSDLASFISMYGLRI